jgi:hypothetical protein
MTVRWPLRRLLSVNHESEAQSHLRKGVFYEGDELDADEIEIEDTLAGIEQAVAIAEREDAAGSGEEEAS